jgi:hypothetical protein
MLLKLILNHSNKLKSETYLIYGSKHSLKPKIWLVDIVGIGATRREFCNLCLVTFSLRAAQLDKGRDE